MPKLPLISGVKALKAFSRLGFVKVRQRGSHAVLRRGGDVCVIPMHREIDPGTLRGALRQAKVTDEEFLEAMR
ncbi:MAG: type II toxin-antitoxin system HicA family toxin [Limisphaerales bacterium]